MENDVTAQILRIMSDRDISRTQLADRLGVGRARVSNMLKPGTNYTVASLERIADALGVELEVVFR